LPWIPVFIEHQNMGKPSFWVSLPTVETLRAQYLAFFG